MGFERLLVLLLLVDKDGVGIAVHGVGGIADAAWFLAGGSGQGAKNFDHLGAIIREKGEANSEADHRGWLPSGFSLDALKAGFAMLHRNAILAVNFLEQGRKFRKNHGLISGPLCRFHTKPTVQTGRKAHSSIEPLPGVYMAR